MRMDLDRLKNLPEFKPMTENSQDKLHQEECKQDAKFVPVLVRNLSLKNAPKLSAKYLQDKTCKMKQMQNIPLTLRTFLNQTKAF